MIEQCATRILLHCRWIPFQTAVHLKFTICSSSIYIYWHVCVLRWTLFLNRYSWKLAFGVIHRCSRYLHIIICHRYLNFKTNIFATNFYIFIHFRFFGKFNFHLIRFAFFNSISISFLLIWLKLSCALIELCECLFLFGCCCCSGCNTLGGLMYPIVCIFDSRSLFMYNPNILIDIEAYWTVKNRFGWHIPFINN